MTLLSGALVAIALAVHQTPQPIVRKPLLDAVIAPDKMVHTAKMVSIDFAPAQKTGAHRHPIPVVGYVVKGSITFQIEGQAARTLAAGEAFFEPADAKDCGVRQCLEERASQLCGVLSDGRRRSAIDHDAA